MSLYLVPGGIDEERLKAVAGGLMGRGKNLAMQAGAPGWLWVDDDPERFGPARDPETGVQAISSGRLAWPVAEWLRAARLPYSGGLANRLMLERYLAKGVEAVAPYNGAVVVAILDPRDKTVHIWTDQFGYHPCYVYQGPRADQPIVTTFPDALLADASVELSYDLVSMAEFVRAWRATPPNTYFTEVKHAGAAVQLTIDLTSGRTSRRNYWQPFEDEFFPSISAAAEELALAVKSSIHERTAIAKRPLFFISGGADSRVMLFCAAERARAVGVNLYEREAAETTVAKTLCELAGTEFISFQRDNDFYPRNLAETVRWSGAMWSAEDTHYLGFADQVAELGPDLVMTACTTDWVFKGYGLEKTYHSLLGRTLPFLTYAHDRVDGFLPNTPFNSPPDLSDAIHERMAAWFEGCPTILASPRDRLMVEDRRVRPAAYTVSVSGQAMYRAFPFDTFLADARVADCYSRTHPDWKLNRELWGKVAARLCEGAGRAVDVNYGWRVDASIPEKAVVFAAGWIGRRIAARKAPVGAQDNSRPPSAGSWPELGWYALHSATLRRLWESVTVEERERMSTICQVDPWTIPLEDWAIDGNHLFRILTLLSHWREIARRRDSARLRPVLAAAVESASV